MGPKKGKKEKGEKKGKKEPEVERPRILDWANPSWKFAAKAGAPPTDSVSLTGLFERVEVRRHSRQAWSSESHLTRDVLCCSGLYCFATWCTQSTGWAWSSAI
jgi:hypothetical protein